MLSISSMNNTIHKAIFMPQKLHYDLLYCCFIANPGLIPYISDIGTNVSKSLIAKNFNEIMVYRYCQIVDYLLVLVQLFFI